MSFVKYSTGRLLVPTLTGPLYRQYLRVKLCPGDGTIRYAPVHHLVLEAFVGPRPEGMNGLHWDDDAMNNQLDNLRWGTDSDNQQDRVRNGRHYNTEKTECIHGHPFSPDNTYVKKNGARNCKTCRKEAAERRKRGR
jgi:hypothetical protein